MYIHYTNFFKDNLEISFYTDEKGFITVNFKDKGDLISLRLPVIKAKELVEKLGFTLQDVGE